MKGSSACRPASSARHRDVRLPAPRACSSGWLRPRCLVITNRCPAHVGVRRATRRNACNLCGAGNDVVVGARDRDGHPLRTVLCRTCGLVWTNPRPSAADMDAYYETDYRADYKAQTRAAAAQDRARLSRRGGAQEDAAARCRGAP